MQDCCSPEVPCSLGEGDCDLDDACKDADIIVTTTGNKDIIQARHFESMKDCCKAIEVVRFDQMDNQN